MPFFSIIIPTYNRAHMLPKALESVYHQTFPDWECIIVDDGSTDNTKEIVQEWIDRDNRFRYIYQQNAERSAARNKGIENAKGEWICFLDSDDYYLENRLKNLFNFIKTQNVPQALLYTGISFLSPDNCFNREVVVNDLLKENVFDYLASNIIGTPQLCIAADILSEYKFDTRFRFSEDLELCFRIARKFPIIPQTDNISIVALEHDNRTCSYVKNNTSAEQLNTWKFILDKKHSGKNISKKQKKWVLSHLFFNEAKYFMYNNKKMQAINKTIIAILINPREKSNKHRIYCLINLLSMRIPKEYNIK